MRESKSEKRNYKKNVKEVTIVEIAYIFTLRVIKLVQTLPKTTVSLEIGKELMRASTSMAAYLEEALAAFSREDFTLNLYNALGEARKTNLCLRLIHDSKLIDSTKELLDLFQESEGIKISLDAITESSQKKL